MRAGVVISRYRRTGGLERVAREWATGLRDRGHDVVVFTQAVEQRDDGLAYVRVGGAESPGWLRAATFPPAAAKALADHPVDVACSFGAAVLAPTVMGTAGPHRAWFEQGVAESPWSTKEGLRRRLNPHHRVVMAMERRIVGGRIFEALYATSRRSADDFRRLYDLPPDAVGVLENGVNLDEFTIDAQARARTRGEWGAGERTVVLTVANEIARKGVDTLVAALPLVRQRIPDALLVLAGPFADEARRLCAAAGIARADVRILGRTADTAAAYNAADVFAFPTRYDPWGLVGIEALACGTPVVCGAAAGIAGHVREGSAGVLLDAVRDREALAEAIASAAALPGGREERRASIEHLSWPRILDRVEKILLDVVARKKERRA